MDDIEWNYANGAVQPYKYQPYVPSDDSGDDVSSDANSDSDAFGHDENDSMEFGQDLQYWFVYY